MRQDTSLRDPATGRDMTQQYSTLRRDSTIQNSTIQCDETRLDLTAMRPYNATERYGTELYFTEQCDKTLYCRALLDSATKRDDTMRHNKTPLYFTMRRNRTLRHCTRQCDTTVLNYTRQGDKSKPYITVRHDST